jgi:hypothetical protein
MVDLLLWLLRDLVLVVTVWWCALGTVAGLELLTGTDIFNPASVITSGVGAVAVFAWAVWRDIQLYRNGGLW